MVWNILVPSSVTTFIAPLLCIFLRILRSIHLLQTYSPLQLAASESCVYLPLFWPLPNVLAALAVHNVKRILVLLAYVCVCITNKEAFGSKKAHALPDLWLLLIVFLFV